LIFAQGNIERDGKRRTTGLNILHVINTLDARYGGPVSVLLGLARAQVAAGHQVSIYTTTNGKQRGACFTSVSALTEFGGVACNCSTAYTPMLLSISFLSLLNREITHFDIVEIHGLYRFPLAYAAWLAQKRGVPYMIRPHGALDPFLHKQSRFGNMALPLKRIHERLFDIPNLNHASVVHFTAKEEMERSAFLKLRAPAVVIPNGIDWREYASLPERGSFRGCLGIEAQTPLVLFLGRINFKKGLDLLVPGFARVLESFPDARLAIVGPDNEGYGAKVRLWCREQGVDDKVVFVDHLGPEKVKRAYVDADVFVLPSYTENFGMTVVEAMACGCPAVISDQVNIWREVQEEGAGAVVGLDPPEIANAVCRVLSNKEAAGEMGRRGRNAAERRYAWPRIVEQITQTYREAIEAAAAKRRLAG